MQNDTKYSVAVREVQSTLFLYREKVTLTDNFMTLGNRQKTFHEGKSLN